MTIDATDLTKALIDNGKIIEAGWVGLRIAAVSPTAPQVQLDEMRMAFFAGAQHLFASIMAAVDGEDEPTDQDMRRIDLIDAELRAFIDAFRAKYGDGK